MQLRHIRLRFRRQFRRSQRQVEELGAQAEESLEKHLYKRFSRLAQVRRFVIGWVLLLVLVISGLLAQNFMLSNYYQTLTPIAGGIYNEGVLGTFTNSNPLYATSDVDSTVSHLLYAGLFTYNDDNKLVGALASSYDVDDKGTTYTVHLKKGLTWQDGKPITAQDVAFTYHAIQNPDALSPLASSWQGITVTAVDANTVTFTLPDPLAAFPYNLTNGIVPEHILQNVPAGSLRTADFDTVSPVGSGPFAIKAVQATGGDPATAQEQISLTAFDKYYGGAPKLQSFIVHAYASAKQLQYAIETNQLNGAEGLDRLTQKMKDSKAIVGHTLTLTAANMVFFKTTDGVLADAKVRQALVSGVDTQSIIDSLGYPARAVREPLLMGQLGYDPSDVQASYNLKAAQAALNADGWVAGRNGIRSKAGQRLSFELTVDNSPEYRSVARQLVAQWRKLGVDVQPTVQESADFQSSLSQHQYDAVLYGISIGVDPDVFVYWDSSQADIRSNNRLNLSEYKNVVVDDALEGARTRLDPALRTIKYKPFLEQWKADAPALGLYQPRSLYITDGTVAGLADHQINTPTDRFDNVQNWEIREQRVTD